MTTQVNREDLIEELTAALKEHQKDMLLGRQPAGCFAYIILWRDGEVRSGLEASYCTPTPDHNGQWMHVVARNTPYDTPSVEDMPFDVERDDEANNLFLVDKDLEQLGWTTEVDGVTGYLTSLDRGQIEDASANVLMGLKWDADRYCGGDSELVNEGEIEEFVDAWLAGDKEKAERIAMDF